MVINDELMTPNEKKPLKYEHVLFNLKYLSLFFLFILNEDVLIWQESLWVLVCF